MKHLKKYNSDGKIIDSFNGSEVDQAREIVFTFDQTFSFPSVRIIDPDGNEISEINYKVEHISNSSLLVRFAFDVLPLNYTIKIF